MYNVLVLLKYIYILIIFLTVITKFDSFDIVAHIDFFSKLGIHIAVIITGCVVQLQVQSCLFNMMHSATCVLKYVV